jgi:spermidine/putrescine transport system ATP-binding protein
MSRHERPAGFDLASSLRLAGVSKAFGNMTALHPLDLEAKKGEFLALLGPSGCGKTTLLRMIGGFLTPSSGRIFIDGQDATGLPPEERRTNMVFQGYGLFPHMTVKQNIAYGLHIAGRPRIEIADRTERMVKLVHLEGMVDRMPATLSGGQQQRVALARALVMEPAVLLLDESLAALDLKLRKAMQDELRQLHATLGGTFIFVTHDQAEAMALASRIILMRDGRIEQSGAPEEIYCRPSSSFAAGFIGDANILSGHRLANRVHLDCGGTCPSIGPDGDIRLMIRPGDMHISRAQNDAQIVTVRGHVTERVFMGDYVRLTVLSANGVKLTIHLPHAAPELRPPVEIALHWPMEAQQVLEAAA